MNKLSEPPDCPAERRLAAAIWLRQAATRRGGCGSGCTFSSLQEVFIVHVWLPAQPLGT
ncbi:MAG: hypothetical protein LR011_05225 [Verrucomicrobia bacterium]|nr:hypothetical protein [Verrucomicrobiota bacterium]